METSVSVNGIKMAKCGCGGICFVVMFVLFLIEQQFVSDVAFAATDSSITVSASALQAISLLPGDFGTTSQTITVTTDNYTGYYATLSSSTSSTGLVNVSDSSIIIPTISLPQGQTSIVQTDFSNEYGFTTNNINYFPVPSAVETPAILKTTNTSGTDTINLSFGVEVGPTTPAGTYQNTVIITAVVNSPQYSITYYPNASDAVTGMPSNLPVTISNSGTITLSNNEPTRTGYTFLGWDTNSTASSPTYSAGGSIDLEPTQANTINLYAIWEKAAEPPVIADYTETFANVTGSTASATTNLATGGSGMSPSEYITKIFAYSNNTGRTISSITVEIVYSKSNQGATSGSLIGKLNYNGTTYTADPVSVARRKVTNEHLSVAQFNNLSIPSSSDISFTIGTDSDAFTAGITISSQTVTVTFAD